MFTLGLFVGCSPDKFENDPQSQYKPIVMNYDVLVKLGATFEEPRDMTQTGKIYSYGSFLLVSERYKGVHIIDNSNPKSPVKLGFIKVLGCVDLAFKGKTLYVDSARDLLAIDISDYKNPKVISRQKNAFAELAPPDGFNLIAEYSNERPPNSVVIEYLPIEN